MLNVSVAPTNQTWYLDRCVVDVGTWAYLEGGVPDALKQGHLAIQVKVFCTLGMVQLTLRLLVGTIAARTEHMVTHTF